MKNFLTIILSLISIWASAQFQDKWHIKFPAGSEPLQVKWADVDNDSILDVVVANRINGRISFQAYSDSAFLSIHELVRTGFVSGTFSLSDFNSDNRMDLIMSGVDTLGHHSTEVYLSNGEFIFTKQAAALVPFSSPTVVHSDLNSDGQDELVMTGSTGHLSVWKWSGSSATQVFDSANFIVHDILVYDFDGNGFNDIAASGVDAMANPKLMIIEFANAFDTIRTVRFDAPITGKMNAGDVNNDGTFDVLLSGLDAAGNSVTQIFLNLISSFVEGETWRDINATSMLIADIDADSLADVAVQGLWNGSAVNFVRTSSGDSLLLPTQNLVTQAFGDYDRDGDLDLMQLQDTLALVVIENQTLNVNPKPAEPGSILADLFIFNRLFVCWVRDSVDNAPAVTYDLRLTADNVRTYAGEFDMGLWSRLTVTHGNRTTRNFALLRIPFADYAVGLQKVDNAFVGSKTFIPPPTHTPAGEVIPGEPCQLEVVTVCPGSLVKPRPDLPTAWFSFSKGFLGEHDSIEVENKIDTLFSFTPNAGDICDKLKIYLINGSGDTVRVEHTTTVCEGTTVDLSTESEWKDVVWWNPSMDSIGSGQTFGYTVRKPAVLKASAHNDYGCVLDQTEILRISKPVLTTNTDTLRIVNGQSVELQASGAHVYVWTPNESLDNGFIPNPVASPIVTTFYTLTGYDTLGCTDTTHVVVEVTQAAFVPNMFTPNGDGRNDQLTIYGISYANNFRFEIHNRNGSLVYETNDVSAVVSHGWDGSTRGVAQPPGLYYWKVEGSFSDGTNLNLSGRTMGSILLVR